ncbi:hypothetical protein ASPVEDRAFT_27208 [Aspergillus versicolor CBS 583.65]|uniref:Uncharacterized protein n=1 Tax=Aspergillus versicolor CBS 583.65 TaxID=1036611 RepID=A0A1L9PG35_ASPVE|nr:uncharacterized protein ASPVEDRAFT_27208 [Aspergillus versicolor CBS 583.65]OJJ00484.1 hypothetical protein ASPVEDRAFT_27208 [Aspergillus versicolor CBS 583.65]
MNPSAAAASLLCYGGTCALCACATTTRPLLPDYLPNQYFHLSGWSKLLYSRVARTQIDASTEGVGEINRTMRLKTQAHSTTGTEHEAGTETKWEENDVVSARLMMQSEYARIMYQQHQHQKEEEEEE